MGKMQLEFWKGIAKIINRQMISCKGFIILTIGIVNNINTKLFWIEGWRWKNLLITILYTFSYFITSDC